MRPERLGRQGAPAFDLEASTFTIPDLPGLQYVDQYRGAAEPGVASFVARADELADAYGERFRPTAYLRDLAAKGETFPA